MGSSRDAAHVKPDRHRGARGPVVVRWCVVNALVRRRRVGATGVAKPRAGVAVTGVSAGSGSRSGIAHTLGKNVVLSTQFVDDIPFDLNRYRHIIYEDNLDGYRALESGMTGALNEIVNMRA